jgi:hypothetical protein
MAITKTQICNFAIGHLGIGKTIADIETERSAEANACRTFYEVCLDIVLAELNWPFAKKFAALALVDTLPTSEWAYSYQYPSDCVKLRKIYSGQRMDSHDTRVPYDLLEATTGKYILTDLPEAEAEYTTRSANVNYFSAEFAMAFSRLLASYIAPSITSGDNFGIGQKQLQIYEIEMSKAKKNALNEIQKDLDPESEFIRARS